MFQASKHRFRVLMSLVDDVLGDPETPLTTQTHPHRRPVRIKRTRRPGSVAARPAHCLCPVRPAFDHGRSDAMTTAR